MFENDYLMHHGIKGQKWGVRRYQNADGSWTAAGRARYSKGGGSRAKYGSENTNSPSKVTKKVEKLNKKIDKLNLKLQNGTARTYGYSEVYIKNHPYDDRSIESRDVFRKGREEKLKELQNKRNALDPSQKNRSGRILTKEEFNRQYNKAIANQLNGGDPIASAVSAHLLNKYDEKHPEHSHDKEYNQYALHATAYGSKKRAKYGNRLNAYDRNRVGMLNEQIDELNEDYQRSHAGRKAVLDSKKPKVARKTVGKALAMPGAIVGTGLGMAAADAIAKTPKNQALLTAAGALVGGLGSAKLGSHLVQKSYNKYKKQIKDEPFDNDIETELNRLIQERNHIDPSQKNRKGRVITKKEYSDYYNASRDGIEGGDKHKGLVSDQMYNDYLKNTTTYGSKKKRR